MEQRSFERLTENLSSITSFNETLWYGTAEQVRVTAEGKTRFIFKD